LKDTILVEKNKTVTTPLLAVNQKKAKTSNFAKASVAVYYCFTTHKPR